MTSKAAHANHQAIANINGYPTWAGWGSAQVMDTAYMMYFARYGHQAYPFITGIDNAYARQHENGFICQESDNDNFEVYSGYPDDAPRPGRRRRRSRSILGPEAFAVAP